jgi:PKD domain
VYRTVIATLAALGLSLALVGGDVQASAASSPASPNFIKPGHPLGMVPRQERAAEAAKAPHASGSNPYCGGCAPPLRFTSGAPVAGGLTSVPGHVTITPVYWAPSGYQYSAAYKLIVNGYIANVAAASNQPSNVFSPSTQYYQTLGGLTTHIQYVITAGSEIDLSDPFPANYPGNTSGCLPDIGYSGCVTDPALRSELQTQLTALSKPIDDGHIYMVMFPYQTLSGNPVQTCFSAGTSTGNSCSSNAYCAYHDGFYQGPAGNNYVLYANEPFPKLSGCNSPAVGVQSPNGDSYADIVLSSFSHEANETVTDAFSAWYDTAGYENGDECAYVYGPSAGSTGVAITAGSASGTKYNQVINGGHYFTQDEFSNEDWGQSSGTVIADTNSTVVYGCVQQEEPPTAAFAAPSPAVNMATTFNGSSSADSDHSNGITGYSWSWGDGSAAGSGATPTHTYSATGTFNVTLTVTDVDGWSGSVSHPVTVTTNGAFAGLYTIDGYGGVHADQSAPMASTSYWPGWKIGHTGKTLPVASGAPQTGFVLDGWGGLHRFGAATITETSPYTDHYWSGWDIARDFAFLPDGTGGFVLDGYGGLHPFRLNGNTAPLQATGGSYFGFDIGRKVVIFADGSGGYILDGWGGLHPFGINGPAPAVTSSLSGVPYWPGWDIARDLQLTPGNGNRSGYVLDGYGGVHPFHPTGDGSVLPAPVSGTYFGYDIARSLWFGRDSVAAAPKGYVMDGYGDLLPFGSEPVPASSTWPGWDIAVAVTGQ